MVVPLFVLAKIRSVTSDSGPGMLPRATIMDLSVVGKAVPATVALD